MSDKGGMTEEDARRFNGFFIMGTAVFIGAAVGAHLLAWAWRPWL